MIKIKNMKKVLIIASEFPPRGVGNILRTVKLVKHLPSFGWKPYVLTISEKWIEKFDYSYNHEIPKEAHIVRALYPNPFILLDRRWHKKRRVQKERDFYATQENTKSRISLKSLAKKTILSTIKFLRKNLFIPEESILWFPFAVMEGFSVCRREKIDLIYSTAPCYTNHLVGLTIKFLTGRRWFADYRDLWTDYPTRKVSSRFHKKIEEFLEKIVLKNADRVNTVSSKWREFLLEKFSFLSPEKVSSYTNGYDSEDYSNILVSHNSNEWRVTYAGTILYNYPTPLFLKAIGELCQEISEVRENFKINFYGRINEHQRAKINEAIKKYSLHNNVSVNGEVAREEALKELKNSQLLLLMYLNGGTVEKDGCIPAKLFEYIGVKKPIFALVPQLGSAAEIIRKGRIGEIVSPNSYEEVKNTLRRLYVKYKNGNDFNPDRNYLKRFERKYIVSKMVELFNGLLR